MQSSRRNSALAIFIMAIFLSPLLTSVHALGHLSSDDDSVPCEQCDILSQCSELDFINVGNNCIEIEQSIVPSSIVLFTHYEISKETIVLPEFIYNKPPPIS